VTIAATASDNTGVISVQFQVDGVNLGPAGTAVPYIRQLQVPLVARPRKSLQ